MPQVQVNDADLYYEEFGSGDALLLLHGMLETSRMYATVAFRLSGSYGVIVPDLRGYGRSGPRPRTFPPDFYARDAADMTALLRRLGLTNVRVVGTGDGGEVALLLALAAPDLIRAVVAVDVAGAFPAALLAALPRLGNWANDPNTEKLVRRSRAIREYGPAGVEALWDGWKAAVRAIIAAGGNISRAQAGGIRCPVLIVNQADDPLNTLAMTHALVDALPRADLHLLQGIDSQNYDTHRYWLGDPVLEWLAAH